MIDGRQFDRLGRAVRRQGGAVSAEHVAVVVLVVTMIAGLWKIGLTDKVQEEADRIADCLFQTDCDPPVAGERPADPTDPGGPDAVEPRQPPACILSAGEQERREVEDRWFRRTVEGERTSTVELIDGSLLITDGTFSGSGQHAGLGIQVPVVGDETFNLAAEGAYVSSEEVGLMYVLDPAARERFEGDLQEIENIERQYLASLAIDLDRTVPDFIELPDDIDMEDADEMLNMFDDISGHTDRRRRRAEAEQQIEQITRRMREQNATHAFTREEGTVTLGLAASYNSVGGDVEVMGSRGVTTAQHLETGETISIVDLSGEVAAEIVAGRGVAAGAGADLGLDASLTIERDGDGATRNVVLTLGGELQAHANVGLDGNIIPALSPDVLRDWGVDVPDGFAGLEVQDGGRWQATFSVPFEEGTEDLVAAFAEDPVGEFPEIAGYAFAEGDVIVEAFEVDEERSESRLGVQLLAGYANGEATSDRQLSPAGAFSYDPANGLQLRPECWR